MAAFCVAPAVAHFLLILLGLRWLSQGDPGVSLGPAAGLAVACGLATSLLLAALGVPSMAPAQDARFHADADADAERLRLALGGASMAAWETDLDSGRHLWDDRMAALVGLSPEGAPLADGLWHEFVHPDDRAEVLAAFAAASEPGGPPFDLEFRALTADGDQRWFASRGVVVGHPPGERRMIGLVQDITSRRQAEEQLRRAHETFRGLIRNDPFGVYLVDSDFRLREVSLGCRKVFANVRPLIGRDFAEVLREIWTEPFASEAIGRFRHTLETGEPYAAPGTVERRRDVDDIEAYDWRIQRIDLPDGRFGVVCYFYDFSQRQRLEVELRMTEERLRQALNAARMDVFEWDVETDRVDRWLGKELLLGEDPAGLGITGREYLEHVHPEDLPGLMSEVESLSADRPTLSAQYRLRTPTGRTIWVHDTARGEFDAAGTLTRLRGVSSNVTELKRAREAVNQSELFHRQALESIPGLVFTSRPDGSGASLGEQWAEFTGVPIAGLLVEGWWSALHPDDRPRAEAAWRAAVANAKPYDAEFRIRRHDGNHEWFKVRARPILDAHGAIARWFGTAVNIDDLKKAEERFAFVRKSTGVGFWYCDLPFDVLAWDEQVKAHFFLPPDAAVTIATFFERIHPDDREPTRLAIERSIADRGAYDVVYRTVDPEQGDERFIRAIGRTSYDEDGTPRRFDGVTVDVTAQKRAEADVRRRERELRALADNTPDILSRFDRDLRHVFVNDAVHRATGRRVEEFLGRTNRELGMPEDLCRTWDGATRLVFDTGRPGSLSFAYPGEEGLRHYSARLIPEFGADGAVESVLGVTHDVTDRVLYEETLREADRRKNEFLATLAHELRNPLAPIRNGLQLLRVAREGQAADLARDIMQRQLAHMVRLVDDLLDVSRISRGKIELRRERILLRTLLDDAVEGSRPMIESARHVLTIATPEGPVWLDGDPIRLSQVVGNLLNNAAKYTPPGGRIGLSAVIEGELVAIRVSDDGVGIPGEMQSRIFDLFTQVDQHRDRAQGGLGIGLSLASTLVGLHGGSIGVESPGPGLGSTFTVRLPLATPEAGHEPRRVHAGTIVDGRDRRLRVLVVDDNADAAVSLAMMIGLAGHETKVETDGSKAVMVASDFQPDLIFLDIGLPGMDGYEICRRLRSAPTGRTLTLVALTGWGTEDDRRLAQEAGFDRHLVKPADPAQIDLVLNGVVERASP